MAIANVGQLDNDAFFERANAIRQWFEPLNPYSINEPLLKIEDANYGVTNANISKALMPLHCFAVSAKRYALFNIDECENPILRKASAHGLGHLMPPYIEGDAARSISKPVTPLSDIGVERWQHDLWRCIVDAALNVHPDRPDLSKLPGFDKPAVSRYAATTPALLRWFDCYNKGRPYVEQVGPFNFLLAMQASMPVAAALATNGPKPHRKRPCPAKSSKMLRPVAPFATSVSEALDACFDRITGKPMHSGQLKTYREDMAQYHLQPEAKFTNGEFLDRGITQRRHIEVTLIHNVGKEANRLEEQFFLGIDPQAQIEYGIELKAERNALDQVRRAACLHGISAIAREAGLSRQYVSEIVGRKRTPSASAIGRLMEVVTSGRIATWQHRQYR